LRSSIVQQAISAQDALNRGERYTVQERLAEITKTLRNLGTGVLGLEGGLPPLVDQELPTGTASVPSLSPPLSLGANSSPLMYMGGDAGMSNGAKRSAELDEGPKKALKLSPPRELEKNSPSPGNSPPMGAMGPPNGMAMSFGMGSGAGVGLNRPIAGMTGMHPPLMHAHTFPGGMHAPHVSSPLAGMSYENMGVGMGAGVPPPLESAPSFRSEPSPPSMSSVDPASYHPHMHSAYQQQQQVQSQGHHAHAGYQISRPSSSHSMHSDESDYDSDDAGAHRHVKQEPGAGMPLSRGAAPRQSPPKSRMGRSGDATPDTSTLAHSANALPAELKNEVDRVFFKFLNRICSNCKCAIYVLLLDVDMCVVEATDSKGEAIHQTLMAKKMARLDELPDFRPFKFRIQAFTNGFLEEVGTSMSGTFGTRN
jgi:hypothetical protein